MRSSLSRCPWRLPSINTNSRSQQGNEGQNLGRRGRYLLIATGVELLKLTGEHVAICKLKMVSVQVVSRLMWKIQD